MREAGLDFEEWKDFDSIRKKAGWGYADYYLRKCENDSKKINEADPTVYQRLNDIDIKLGTELSLQLWCCLCWTTRWDIIKVFFIFFECKT